MTTIVKPVRWTGPFTDGEIPLSFLVKFDPTDLDFQTGGYTIEMTLEDDDGTEMTPDGSVAWEVAAEGIARVQLGAADVAVPTGKLVITRRLMVWTGNGVNRVATVEIKYNCHPAIGTPPSI